MRRALAPALLVATWFALAPLAGGPEPYRGAFTHHLALGRALLERAPAEGGGSVSYRMPLGTLAAALASRVPPPLWDGARRAALAGLLLALALALGQPAAAPAAALLWALEARGAFADHAQTLYTLAVLAVALALVRRARDPGPASSALLALALGASLLLRSPLLMFPPLLLAAESFRRRPGRADAAWLLLGPAALLLPWVWMNWRVHGAFVPLEHGAASSNLIGGALGLVGTMEGDARALLPPGVTLESGLWAWAAREAAAHPLRAAEAFLRRLHLLAGTTPLLFALGAAAAWRGRADGAVRALAGLASYLLAAHAALAAQANYALPASALSAALGAHGLLSLLRPAPAPGRAAGRGGAWVAAGISASAAIAVLGVCARYGWAPPAPRPASLAAPAGPLGAALAAARAADDEAAAVEMGRLLRSLRAEARVRGDAGSRAVERLADSRRVYEALARLGSAPEETERLARAWRRAAPEDFWGAALLARSARGPEAARARADAARLARLTAHRVELYELSVAAQDIDAAAALARGLENEADASLPRLLALARARGRDSLADALLARALARPAPGAALLLEHAEREAAAGRRDAARAALARALRAGVAPGEDARLASLHLRLGEGAAARERAKAALARGGGAELGLLLARTWALEGDWEQARAALSLAEDRGLSAADARRAALLRQEWGDPRGAAGRLAALSAASPHDAALRADLGVALFLAGEKKEGLDALRAAVGLPGAPPEAFASLAQALDAAGRRDEAAAARRRGRASFCGGASAPPLCAALEP